VAPSCVELLELTLWLAGLLMGSCSCRWCSSVYQQEEVEAGQGAAVRMQKQCCELLVRPVQFMGCIVPCPQLSTPIPAQPCPL